VTHLYLDTSAFLRACLREAPDHAAALALLDSEPRRLISSELLAVEADRAAIRLASEDPSQTEVAASIHEALRRVSLVRLDPAILLAARTIPQGVTSLDAIHLATAEWLGDIVDCVVTYDKTMTAVARERGLTVHTAADLIGPSTPDAG